MPAKLTYETVKKRVRDSGYELLTPKSEYENTRSRVKYKCLNCGSTSETNCNNLLNQNEGYCDSCSPGRTDHKVEFTDEEKQQIISDYGDKFIVDIADEFDVSGVLIRRRLQEWDVELMSENEIAERRVKKYGPTPGFEGKSHSEESKQAISKSLKDAYESGEKDAVNGHSKYFETDTGIVQGRYELVYLYLNNNLELPSLGIETPHGIYIPDFEAEDYYVEVKSEFTLEVAKGEREGLDGKLDDTQWKKIQWVDKNKKPVEVEVISRETMRSHISKAKNTLVSSVT